MSRAKGAGLKATTHFLRREPRTRYFASLGLLHMAWARWTAGFTIKQQPGHVLNLWGDNLSLAVIKVKVKLLSHARLFATPWIVACTKLLCPWDFQGKSTGVGCHFLLLGIFPTQGSNRGLLHCRQMLYHLSHQGSPKKYCMPLNALSSDFLRLGPYMPSAFSEQHTCVDIFSGCLWEP